MFSEAKSRFSDSRDTLSSIEANMNFDTCCIVPMGFSGAEK